MKTQEEILEYNKRCAEFLGMYDYSKDNEYFEKNKYFCYPQKDKNPGSGYFDCRKCFIEDWNWIMEVVESIEKIEVQETIKEIPNMELERRLGRVLDLPIYTKKEAVVQAINQFLIWYKENNK